MGRNDIARYLVAQIADADEASFSQGMVLANPSTRSHTHNGFHG